jgi:hypothetical protein
MPFNYVSQAPTNSSDVDMKFQVVPAVRFYQLYHAMMLVANNPLAESGCYLSAIVLMPLFSTYSLSDGLWIHSVWIIRIWTLSRSPRRTQITAAMVSAYAFLMNDAS